MSLAHPAPRGECGDAVSVLHGPPHSGVMARVAKASPRRFTWITLVQHLQVGFILYFMEKISKPGVWKQRGLVENKIHQARRNAVDGDLGGRSHS